MAQRTCRTCTRRVPTLSRLDDGPASAAEGLGPRPFDPRAYRQRRDAPSVLGRGASGCAAPRDARGIWRESRGDGSAARVVGGMTTALRSEAAVLLEAVRTRMANEVLTA